MGFLGKLLVWGSFGGATYGTANYWYDRGMGGSQSSGVQLLKDFYYPDQSGGSAGRKMMLRLGFGVDTNSGGQVESPSDADSTSGSTSSAAHPTHDQFDVVIVGGGIVGLAVAREVRSKFPKKTVAVIEKEANVAVHQSAHNSGVIHAGIYDKETSLKTTLCIAGNKMMYDYCKKHKLPVKNVGKLVVAVNEEELVTLDKVYQQATKNGAGGPVRMLNSLEEIKAMEPNVQGLKALYCPSTGIADYAEVTRHMLRELEKDKKFTFIPKFQVEAIGTFYHLLKSEQQDKKKNVSTPSGGGVLPPPETRESACGRVAILGREPGQCGPTKVVEGKKLITCGGLHMDSIARMAGGAHNPTVVPFRGRYYELTQSAKGIVSANVYPVPRQGGIPVGVHFTPTVSVERGEQMIIGPGAAFSPHKEGYRLNKFDWTTFMNCLFSKANWTFLGSNYAVACDALHQDMSRDAFIQDARRMVPSLRDEDVVESYAGVMAQCFGADGKPIGDFMFEATHAPDFETPPLGNLAHHQAKQESRYGVSFLPDVPNMMSSVVSSVTGAKAIETPTKGDDATESAGSSSSCQNINNSFHMRHAPSPAATCAFALAEEMVKRAAKEINL